MKEIRYYSSKELEEMRKEEKGKSIISIGDIWGNKKEYQLENGILYLSEEKEKEFEEMGIIQEGERGRYIESGDRKISYRIDEKKGKKEFQFHQSRKSSYKIISERIDDINYRMILFPKKDFNRIEIWRFPKGGKREMIFRNDSEEYDKISSEWKKIGGKDINISEEIKKII